MVDEVFNLMRYFPNSFINCNRDVILSKKGNVYFNAMDCADKNDIICKLFEWCSRPIAKGIVYSSEKRNKAWREDLLNNLNEYLGAQFSLEDMYYIYQELGNGVNHNLVMDFIESNYDMALIYGRQKETEELDSSETIEL